MTRPNDEAEQARDDLDSIELRAFLKDLLHHEDTALWTRTDWFLIFHAILLEAFFSAESWKTGALPVVVLGVVTSVIWLTMAWRQMSVLDDLKERLKIVNPAYREILDARGAWGRFREPHNAKLAWWMPLCVTFAWIAVACIARR